MKLVFLGTSASSPTVERNLSSVALEFNGEWLLFDCPEGTQRQLMRAGISFMKIEKIFFSHFHLDHILGLPGLVATMHMLERKTPLSIYGPRRLREKMNALLALAPAPLSFDIELRELKSGINVKQAEYSVSAMPLKHDVPCHGFLFCEADKKGEFVREKAKALGIPEGPLWRKLQLGKSVKVNGSAFKPVQVMDYSKGRKGRRVAIIADTRTHESYLPLLKNADVVVHECTFGSDKLERALETKHAVAADVAALAQKAKARQLVLYHFSPRYKDAMVLVDEAKTVFENTISASDLLEINVPLSPAGKQILTKTNP